MPDLISVDNYVDATNILPFMDFLQIFLPAFFGFLSAIVSSIILDRLINYREKSIIKNGIDTEFKQAMEQLKKISFDGYFILPLPNAYWSALIQGSKLGIIYKAKWYAKVSFCYSKIDMLNFQINMRNSKKLESSMLTNDEERLMASNVVEMMEKLIRDETSDRNGALLKLLCDAFNQGEIAEVTS